RCVWTLDPFYVLLRNVLASDPHSFPTRRSSDLVITPYPGTPLHAEAERSGWIESADWRDSGGHQVVMRTPHLSRDDLVAAPVPTSEEHTSELQLRLHHVCLLLLDKNTIAFVSSI